MKTNVDLVLGWIRKGDSDLTNAGLCIASDQALDTACFHAQQAAEKFLKAYLIAHGLSFPFTHNLEKLIEICEQHNAVFTPMKLSGAGLTPYAVSMRYDEDFWPTLQTATEARDVAMTFRAVVISRLPAEVSPIPFLAP